MMPQTANAFRDGFRLGHPLVGSFIKSPGVCATEILGDLGFDFIVVDEEHAPLGRAQTDLILLAAKAAGIAAIVRVPAVTGILGALDDGADGVLVPHVSTAAGAREMVSACRYRGGRRGFSNSPRAGRYGALAMGAHVDRQDAAVAAIAMIEDPEALPEIDAIMAVEGLDGIFIGRGDLAVAMNASGPDAPVVRSAVEAICTAARNASKPICLMVGDAGEADNYRVLGASAFIVASDQAFMRRAASEALKGFRD